MAGMVGWLLPSCCGSTPSMSHRAAWKSSRWIAVSSKDVCTHWPRPVRSRANRAAMTPWARKVPATTSDTATPTLHGPLPGGAGDGHQPAHTLGDLVHARPVGVRAVLTETRNAAIHQSGVAGQKPIRARGPDGASRPAASFPGTRRPGRPGPPCAAIPAGSLRSRTTDRLLRLRFISSEPPRPGSPRPDPNHVGPEIGELAGAGGTGPGGGVVHHPDSVQGARHRP